MRSDADGITARVVSSRTIVEQDRERALLVEAEVVVDTKILSREGWLDLNDVQDALYAASIPEDAKALRPQAFMDATYHRLTSGDLWVRAQSSQPCAFGIGRFIGEGTALTDIGFQINNTAVYNYGALPTQMLSDGVLNNKLERILTHIVPQSQRLVPLSYVALNVNRVERPRLYFTAPGIFDVPRITLRVTLLTAERIWETDETADRREPCSCMGRTESPFDVGPCTDEEADVRIAATMRLIGAAA